MGRGSVQLEEACRQRSDTWFRTSLLAGGDREVARDALQGVLERLVRRRLSSDINLNACVTSCLVNATRDRRRRRRHEVPLDGVEPRYRDAVEHVDGMTSVVLETLRTLPARQRDVLVLRYFEDLSEAETARVMQTSIGTVKTQAHRGQPRLRSALSATEETT